MYLPAIKSAEQAQRFLLKDHSAVLLRNIVAEGSVEYLYVVLVYDGSSERISFCVASERNAMAEELGGGSHFLGVFVEDSHVNYGSSNDWADEAKFTAKALELICEKYGPPLG